MLKEVSVVVLAVVGCVLRSGEDGVLGGVVLDVLGGACSLVDLEGSISSVKL